MSFNFTKSCIYTNYMNYWIKQHLYTTKVLNANKFVL